MRKDSSENTSKKEGNKYGDKSVSDKDRKPTLEDRQKEYKDQEVMDKKPYKQ